MYRPALEAKYPFLPMTWIDFDFAAGVCCIDARELRGQREAILAQAG